MSKKRITVVIADAGPLISLAMGRALDLLLLARPGVQLVLIDVVRFEVTALADRYADGGEIAKFLAQNVDRIDIKETTIGKLALPTMRLQLARGERVQWGEDFGELSISGFILDSSVERARVGCWRRVRVGREPQLQTCLRRFGRLEQAKPLAWQCPARATTLRANAREAEQRPRACCQWLNRVRSAVTLEVNPVEVKRVNVHKALVMKRSGQLRNLGLSEAPGRLTRAARLCCWWKMIGLKKMPTSCRAMSTLFPPAVFLTG